MSTRRLQAFRGMLADTTFSPAAARSGAISGLPLIMTCMRTFNAGIA